MAREIHVLFSQGEEREKENSRWMFSRRNMETEVARGKHGKRVGHEQDGEEEEMCIPTSEYIFHGEGGRRKSSHRYERGNAVPIVSGRHKQRRDSERNANDYHLEDDGWEPDCARGH